MSDYNNEPDRLSRRGFCRSAAWLGAGVVSGVLSRPSAASAADAAVHEAATPAQALELLREGNARFVAGKTIEPDRSLATLRSLAPQQAPWAALLGCADSRVPIEILYDQGFGDLFVVRVAGNIATSVEIASLEFGALVLGAKLINVLGHTNCGAVKAALAGGEVPGQISTLYQHIMPALEHHKMDLDAAIVANVRFQARQLRRASPVLGRLVTDGKLAIVGGVFDLESGVVKPVEV